MERVLWGLGGALFWGGMLWAFGWPGAMISIGLLLMVLAVVLEMR